MQKFRQILPIMIAMIALSGCAGRKMKAKPISYSNTNKNTGLLETNDATMQLKIIDAIADEPYCDTAYRAKNQYKIDQDKSLELTISEYGYTRVSIEDERITDVFVFPQENAGVKIHQQGYLIIAPNPNQNSSNFDEEEGGTHHNTQLTITGEHGTTQDFSLRLTGKAPEPVKFIK